MSAVSTGTPGPLAPLRVVASGSVSGAHRSRPVAVQCRPSLIRSQDLPASTSTASGRVRRSTTRTRAAAEGVDAAVAVANALHQLAGVGVGGTPSVGPWPRPEDLEPCTLRPIPCTVNLGNPNP
jgi:hypothetical protein